MSNGYQSVADCALTGEQLTISNDTVEICYALTYWKFDPEYPHEFEGIEDVLLFNSREAAMNKVSELGMPADGWEYWIKELIHPHRNTQRETY